MRVFLGLAEVSGFYTNLKKGFDAIGVHSELVTLSQHRFDYENLHRSIWIRMAQAAVSGRFRHRNASALVRMTWSVLVGISRALLLAWALLRFDVFVFCCATSFFQFRELPLMKLLGKKVIYNFHGTDGRCGFMDGFAEDMFMPLRLREGTGYIGPLRDTDSEAVKAQKTDAYAAITALRKANIDRIDRYADAIINSPSHGQHHTRPFVQRLIIGMPYMPDRELIDAKKNRKSSDHVRILHCPSYPEGKGTLEIRKAVSAVRARGYAIDFIEMTGRPNREVLENIRECDFIIDQLYSDMAMVGFATEAAFFGKPAIVGGYYSGQQTQDIAEEWIPPTLFCLPEELEPAIEKLVRDTSFRYDLGQKARAFVEERWLASKSAERILTLAKGTIPEEWLYDPKNCNYVGGMGLSENQLEAIITELHARYGMGVFRLSDKPLMEQSLRKVIGRRTMSTQPNIERSKN